MEENICISGATIPKIYRKSVPPERISAISEELLESLQSDSILWGSEYPFSAAFSHSKIPDTAALLSTRGETVYLIPAIKPIFHIYRQMQLVKNLTPTD